MVIAVTVYAVGFQKHLHLRKLGLRFRRECAWRGTPAEPDDEAGEVEEAGDAFHGGYVGSSTTGAMPPKAFSRLILRAGR